jgi:hypothetical protein
MDIAAPISTPRLECLYALVKARAPRPVIEALKADLTDAERRALHGDLGCTYQEWYAKADAMLIERYEAKLPMGKLDAKRARRLIRERKKSD